MLRHSSLELIGDASVETPVAATEYVNSPHSGRSIKHETPWSTSTGSELPGRKLRSVVSVSDRGGAVLPVPVHVFSHHAGVAALPATGSGLPLPVEARLEPLLRQPPLDLEHVVEGHDGLAATVQPRDPELGQVGQLLMPGLFLAPAAEHPQARKLEAGGVDRGGRAEVAGEVEPVAHLGGGNLDVAEAQTGVRRHARVERRLGHASLTEVERQVLDVGRVRAVRGGQRGQAVVRRHVDGHDGDAMNVEERIVHDCYSDQRGKCSRRHHLQNLETVSAGPLQT